MGATYEMNPRRNYSIAIVGGGIGGLCTAIGLLHQGIQVDIYEAAAAFSEIGAGVGFGPNATRAMKMIDPAIYEGFRKKASTLAGPKGGNWAYSYRLGDDASKPQGECFYDMWNEETLLSIHRADFLDQLVALIPSERAHFGKRLLTAEEDGDMVTLHFQDGTKGTHDALIGCDGVKSKTRPIILGHDDPTAYPVFTGKYAYRGLVPMDEAAAVLGDDLARHTQMYLGHDAHVLTFPIEEGKTFNVVAFSTKADGKWEDSDWVKPVGREAMSEDYSSWSKSVQQVVSLMQKPEMWALFNHLPAPTYCKGRMCMLGDAAHATTPHCGAGAGMAIEDAVILSRALGLAYDSKDIKAAFAAFDKVRRPRSQRLVEVSKRTGLLYQFQDPDVLDDLEKFKEELVKNFQWIWNHDLEADAKQLETIFKEGH